MQRNARFMVGVLAVASLQLSACRQATPPPATVEASHVEHIEGSDLALVTLTERAMERLDLQTVEIFERVMPRSSLPRACAPYSALIYDPEGRTWVYTTADGLTFERQEVVIDYIEGDVAVLASGPAVGTVVASVGVAELYGTEFEVGH